MWVYLFVSTLTSSPRLAIFIACYVVCAGEGLATRLGVVYNFSCACGRRPGNEVRSCVQLQLLFLDLEMCLCIPIGVIIITCLYSQILIISPFLIVCLQRHTCNTQGRKSSS